jgi:hypothetical protein
MMVLRKAGNESALHTLGNYQQSRSEKITLTDNARQEESEVWLNESRLAPWIAWMEAVGFENLWNKKVE